MIVSEDLASEYVVNTPNQRGKKSPGWLETRENLRMHRNFQNCIRGSDVDRPHGFERVILNDCTRRCNAWLSWTRFVQASDM